jgi:ferritin
MISKKMTDALNVQINKEIYSAYIYLSMAAYSEHIGLKGIANWFTVQYQEETGHAMRIYKYLQEQGAQVKLQAIEQPQTDYKSPTDMFEKTLAHEQYVTKSINGLVDLALKENDHATQIFLQWFVTEQVEEEANDHEILDKLKMIGESGSGLYMLDRELGARTFHS